ncbi:MAG: alpha/beta fold hydrolase [Planctomycetota bacterium]|nr:alpha/beta fold hydrolase [Planctomycetota bacterium]MDA1141945.1 alpha/beta fold hydrolase [Planctomycetota bacterium]
MEKPVAFQNENRLVGTLNLPENGDAGRAGVVFLHGWSGYRSGPHRMFVHAARHLAEEGIASLRFDLSGRGDSNGDKDDTNLDDMISDTLAAKTFLAQEAKVSKPVLLGICSGGNVSIGSASLDKEIAGLVLWSTPLFAAFKKASDKSTKRRMMLMEYLRKALRPSTWIRLIRGQVNVGMVGKAISGDEEKKDRKGRNPKDSLRDIMSDLKGYKGPILFIYGTNDDEVIGAPVFYEEYCRENGIDVAVHFIEGANHNFYSIDWEKQVLEITADWLKRKVR